MNTDFVQERLLNWPDCLNTRELGGYPLPNGRQTRWKAIVQFLTGFSGTSRP